VNITIEKLQAAIRPLSREAAVFVPLLNEWLPKGGIDTQARAAYFLAEAAYESMHFARTREIWGPTEQQKRYERDFTKPWFKGDPVNKLAFELGNSEAGDGRRFLGRGLFEETGRANYLRLSHDLYGDDRLVQNERLLEEPEGAVRSAVNFWVRHDLSKFADAGDFHGTTRVINGGETGESQRLVLLQSCAAINWMA
jgi:putative chitinase